MNFRICTLILTALLLVIGTATAGDIENMLTNPDFDDGTNGWSLSMAGDGNQLLVEKGGVVGDCAHAVIKAVGANNWEPEIHSPKFDVKQGNVYTVSFWAKTEKGSVRELSVKFEQLDTWTGPSTNINVTDEWAEYHFSPEMTMSSPPQVVIHIGFQRLKDDVWFDHFRVYLGEYVEDDLLGGGRAVTVRGKLTTMWGSMKKR